MAFSQPCKRRLYCISLLLAWFASSAAAFAPSPSLSLQSGQTTALKHSTTLKAQGDDGLEQSFGGYTVKQRLREEVESPFRTVRLFFFGSSTGSALVALYFSLLTTAKASAGFSDVPPMEEAIQSVLINLVAVVVCAGLTYRDWKAGEANLARIKQGGALAKLMVQRASNERDVATLSDYRRNARVLIAAGGADYIAELCRSLNADQRADANTLPEAIANAEILLVPVLLEQGASASTSIRAVDTQTCWKETVPVEDRDANFDVTRANDVVGFPRGPMAWTEVLEPEIETATGQGFDVLSKGITLIIKKNGKILRRATGQPQWSGLLGTMEVLDGSKFGMPGDDEVYGSGKRPSV